MATRTPLCPAENGGEATGCCHPKATGRGSTVVCNCELSRDIRLYQYKWQALINFRKARCQACDESVCILPGCLPDGQSSVADSGIRVRRGTPHERVFGGGSSRFGA